MRINSLAAFSLNAAKVNGMTAVQHGPKHSTSLWLRNTAVRLERRPRDAPEVCRRELLLLVSERTAVLL